MTKGDKIYTIIISWILCALSVSQIYFMVCMDKTWMKIVECFGAAIPMVCAMIKIGALVLACAKKDAEKE